ncbi:YbaB/EbfC family DNA-binding protein [Saccharopolyspora sp. NPDC002686]|uniref:YbaB/EbfC family DNA-binding protein n=1 Tax=Saccharopolyspora sp. NPDC002686 TaxID=3154541 RepID=UPI0033260D3E
MTDPDLNGVDKATRDLEAAMAALDEERQRLDEISRIRREETTVVQAKDHSLEMTFDGNGELAELKFNGAKYRTMAPAQLASVIVETLRVGRAQSMEKITSLLSSDLLPGIDLAGVMSGKVDPQSVVDAFMEPMLGMLDGERKSGSTGKGAAG